MSIKDGIVGAMVVGGGSGGGGGTPVVPNINATAESLPAGSEATVEKSGTNTNVTFNFGIPRGADGQQGAPGATGPAGPQGAQGPQGPAGPTGPAGQTGPAGPQGVQGPQGDAGTPFLISKIYATYEDMNAGYATDGLSEGQLVAIATDTGGSYGGWIYAKGASAYDFFYDISTTEGIQGPQGPQGEQGPQGPAGPAGATGATGPAGAQGAQGPKGDKGDTGEQGPQGPAGQAATIQVGTVTTGEPGTNASVTNSGTSSAAVFDFVIPRGQDGSGGGGAAGVSSFNGRTGAVVPQDGDYTAAQVGAADATTTQQALQALSDEIDGILAGTSPITIPPATEVKVGGIKVGEGLSATTDGTTSVAISQEANNATGILNGALYTSIPRPSAVYPLMEVTTAPATASIQVTATKGELSVQGTTNENGKVDIELSAFGVWTFTATIDGEQATADVAVNASQLYTLNLTPYKVYGAEWDGSSSPEWSRTDDAELFQDPQPAVNNGTGSSPFDNIMPWAGMVKVEDEVAGTLVAIPKYWYKWTRNGASMKLQISSKQIDGFYVSPAHADRGDGQGERDVIYVGRYACTSDYKSTSGETPYCNQVISVYRAGIHDLGSEYWQWDWATYLTVAMLMLVEYANWDFQTVIGYGGGSAYGLALNGQTDSMIYHTGTTATNKETNGYVQYRNIEGLWSNAYSQMDGIYASNYTFYCTKNPNDFGQETTKGVNIGTVTGSNIIMSYNLLNAPGYEWAICPAVANGDSAYSYITNYCQCSSGSIVVGCGSNWDKGYGVFYMITIQRTSLTGSRIMKLPNGGGV